MQNFVLFVYLIRFYMVVIQFHLPHDTLGTLWSSLNCYYNNMIVNCYYTKGN